MLLIAALGGRFAIAQSAPSTADPQRLFAQGEAALKSGKLDEAERDFRAVVALQPGVAGAYANLAVIAMRRKQWPQALDLLHHAERLAPQIPGIRLNIGLVFYRQAQYEQAIAPFQSVVRDLPDAVQPRYLLGLCEFFTERYDDATIVLAPLWEQESSRLSYLYVLGIAAGKAKQPALEQRALGRLVEIGEDSPEFHLLMGKAHLNREEYDDAIRELKLAAAADPKLPYLHFNLGVAYFKKQELDLARTEFMQDIGVEPGVAYDYDQLGAIDFAQRKDADAEKALRTAIRLDPGLVSSHYQLARVYQREEKYELALREIDTAMKSAPENSSVHYIRGQLLQKLGRAAEARTEMQKVTNIDKQARDKREKELESPLPSPEVAGEPK